jgi:hypothetical protein
MDERLLKFQGEFESDIYIFRCRYHVMSKGRCHECDITFHPPDDTGLCILCHKEAEIYLVAGFKCPCCNRLSHSKLALRTLENPIQLEDESGEEVGQITSEIDSKFITCVKCKSEFRCGQTIKDGKLELNLSVIREEP